MHPALLLAGLFGAVVLGVVNAQKIIHCTPQIKAGCAAIGAAIALLTSAHVHVPDKLVAQNNVCCNLPSPGPSQTPGGIITFPSPLPVFPILGGQQTLSVFEPGYNGAFTYSGCNSVAALTPTSGMGPNDDLVITAIANGTCTLTIQGFVPGTVAVTVNTPTPSPPPTPPPTPTPPPPTPTPAPTPTPTPVPTPTPIPTPTPTPTPGAMSFTPNPLPPFTAFGQIQSVTVNQPNYTGLFSANTGCALIASIAPSTVLGPNGAFNITANANGTCTVTITGYNGAAVFVPVTITTPTPPPTPTPSPSPTPTPGAITFTPNPVPNFTALNQTQAISVTEQWWSGVFGYSGCSGILTLSPTTGTGPTASFNARAIANGTCNITVSGFFTNTATIPITVVTPTPIPTATPTPVPTPTPTPTPGPPVTAPSPFPPFTLAWGQQQSLSVFETGWNGVINASGCTNGVATITPTAINGPSGAFTITSALNGTCTETFVGFGGKSAAVAISVASPTPQPTGSPSANGILPYMYASESGAGCGGGSQGLDPGATADKNEIWALETCSSADVSGGVMIANCPGRSGSSTCQAYSYIDVLLNACNGASTTGAYNYALAHPTAFLHVFGSSSTVLTQSQTSSPPCATNTAYRMNAGDAGLNAYLAANVWNALPAGWGRFHDDAQLVYGSPPTSNEYGSPAYTYIAGTSQGGTSSSTWLTGIGQYANGDATHHVVNALCCGGNPLCATIVSAHCEGGTKFALGYYDNQVRIDQICSQLTGTSLDGLVSERLLSPTGSGPYGPLIAAFLNLGGTLVTQHKTDNCAQAKLIALESTTNANFPNARSSLWALTWLMTSADGTPDLLHPWQYCVGATATEVCYFPEYTLLPYGGTPLTQYVFNGKKLSNGTGCDNVGDTGGGIGEIAQCVNTTSPLYIKQYPHCNLNHVDQGPCAALLNTSTTAVTLTAAMFQQYPASTYNAIANFVGYEATSIADSNVGGGTISLPCTNTNPGPDGVHPLCGGTLNLNSAPFVLGSTQIGPQSGMILDSAGSSPTGSAYIFKGCGVPVQVYNGTAGTADPILNADISAAPVDTNNTSLQTAWGTTSFSGVTDTSSLERVNCTNNQTPTFVVMTSANGGGHNPPVSANSAQGLGGKNATIPWCGAVSGTGCPSSYAPSVFEGRLTAGNCSGPPDCHVITLNTDSKVVTECGGEGGNNTWTGSAFHAFSCFQANLNASFTANWLPNGTTYGDNTGDCGCPQLGTDLGVDDMDDAIANGATVLNHPLNLILPTNMSICFSGCATKGVNISPGVGADGSCTTTTGCFLYGDLFRLKSSVSCGSNASAIIVCNTLKKRGMYLSDTGSIALRMMKRANGTGTIDTNVISWLQGLHISDFQIIQRGWTKP